MTRTRGLLAAALLVTALFGALHLDWGLPGAWHPDTKVPLVLRMAANKSLDPDYFINPSFHLYLTGACLAPYAGLLMVRGELPRPQTLHAAPEWFLTGVFLIGRALSVLMSVLTAWATYLLGRRLADERAGLLAAWGYAVTLGAMNLAHFATPETTLTFLMTMTLVHLLDVFLEGRRRDFWLAGLFLGLALSTKYTALVLVPFVGLAPFLRHGARSTMPWKCAAISLSVALVAFLVTTPYALLDFGTFWKHFQFALAAQTTYRGFTFEEAQWLPTLGHFADLFGWPLWIACLGGLLFGIMNAVRRSERRLWLVIGYIVLTYVLLGRAHLSAMRYAFPVAPAMLALMSAATVALLDRGQRIRTAVKAGIFFVLAFSAVNCCAGLWIFARESRYEAGTWIREHVEPGATVGFFAGYHDESTGETFPDAWLLPLEIDLRYPDRQYTVTFLPEIEDKSASIDSLRARLRDDGPEYLLLARDDYRRYFDYDDYPERRAFYRDLLDGDLGYERAARFHPAPSWWLPIELELVNPELEALRRR